MTPAPVTQLSTAFTDVYREQVGYVWNCLRRLGVQERDIDDQVHELFITVPRRAADCDAATPLRPWRTGSAASIAADARKSAYHRRTELDAEPSVNGKGSAAADPETALADQQTRALIMRALEPLAAEQREVFVLHDIEGYSMPEIAEMVDRPLNTLYSRLRIARRKFAESIGRLQGMPS